MRITFLILLILLVLCSKITDSNNSILVKPSVCFFKNNEPVTPEFINKIIITVTFGNTEIKDTFNFDAHEGTLKSFIPKNTPFTLELEALDRNTVLIYHSGKLEFPGFTADDTVNIKANQVTPSLPENLKIPFRSDSVRILQWMENSVNAEGFIIEKSVQGTNRFITVDTVDTNIFIDTSTIKNTSVFYYRIMAFNSIGKSSPVSISFDPKETVSTPENPTSNNEIFYINITSSFEIKSATCENGHPAEYQFDWGDNTRSDWLSKPISSHAWEKNGTYGVKCRIRCSKYIDVVSNWSKALHIKVVNR